MERYVTFTIWILILFLAVAVWRLRRRSVTPGAAAAAAMHDLLNDDRRAAVQIILEDRTAAQDPEDRADRDPVLRQPYGEMPSSRCAAQISVIDNGLGRTPPPPKPRSSACASAA